MTPDVRVALVSCPAQQAEGLARELVELRLAACVNLLPRITSIYRWDGAVQQDEETLLLIKTTAAQVEALRAAVIARHPYAVPEFLALAVSEGHAPYLDWVRTSCAPA